MNIIIEKGVPVRMRDGVTLATDVYRPDTGERCPTLVTRLPYNKEVNQLLNFGFDVLRGVQAGYVGRLPGHPGTLCVRRRVQSLLR